MKTRIIDEDVWSAVHVHGAPDLETFKADRLARLAKRDAQTFEPKHRLGDDVNIGKGITATIEEIIWARNMTAPFYLVEWWHEGQLVSRRVHEEDCK